MTFTTAPELIEAVRHLAPNISNFNIPDDKIETYCSQAVRRLSEDRPRELTGTFSGLSTQYHKLVTRLPLWVDDFSTIRSLVPEAPVLADGELIQYSEPEDYQLYNDGTGEHIRFNTAPDETVVVRYTTVYTVNGLDGSVVASTVPARYMNAVEFLTTSLLCAALATQAAGLTDSELSGDLINYRTKSREYRQMAEDWEKRYLSAVGLGKESQSQVGAAISRRAYAVNEGRRFARLTH